MGGIPVGPIRGTVMLVITDQDERRNSDFPEPCRMIVFLARNDELKIVFERRDPGHSDLEKLLDQVRVGGDERARPAGFNRMLPDITLESEPDHVTAHPKWNSVSSGMR